MAKPKKPALNRPDLEDEPPPQKPAPALSVQAAPIEPLTAEEQAEQDAITQQFDRESKRPLPKPETVLKHAIRGGEGEFPEGMGETRQPTVDDVTGDFLKQIIPRLRVAETAGIAEIFQAIIDGKWSRRAVLLTPFNRPINPHAHFALMAHMRKNPWCGYEYETDTVIQRARNMLADRFMKSEAEWAIWMDQDTVAPFGHPGWFYTRMGFEQNRVNPEHAGLNAIQRLLSHGKKIVGGVYKQRKPNGLYVIQPHLHPRGPQDAELVNRLKTQGPFDELVEVGYVATGCALVHRSVYTDVQKAHPALAPQNAEGIWNYYGTDTNASGEDIAFCKLAKDAGHQSWLDCGLFCSHLGEYGYNP